MEALPNDVWRGEFIVGTEGRHLYSLQAWIDHFQSWTRGFGKEV